MVRAELKIIDPIGLHARPASLACHIASQCKTSNVHLIYNEKSVNMKSIMGVLSMGVSAGSIIVISCEGPDEVEDLKRIEDYLIENKVADHLNGDPILLDFYADWCGPCMMMSTIIEEVLTEIPIQCNKINIDLEENRPIVDKYGISSIPTLLLVKGGKVIGESVGFKPKEELIDFLKEVKPVENIE